MSTHSQKIKQKGDQAASHSNANAVSKGRCPVGIENNRAESHAQRKLQRMVNSSHLAEQAVQLQGIADDHTAGNLAETSSQRAVQLRIPSPKAWKSSSFKWFKSRSTALKSVDTAVNTWAQGKDDADLNKRTTTLDTLSTAVETWENSKEKDEQGKVKSSRQANIAMLKEKITEERQKLRVMTGIRDRYGITIHNKAGMQAAATFYQSLALGKKAPRVKTLEWELQELQDLERVLSFYGPLLGGSRDVTALGAQSISTFSRLNVGLDEEAGKIKRDPDTYAETFTQTVGTTALSNISVYNKAYSPDDFATGREQMRGTTGHELSHALLEPLPAPGGGKMIDYFATQMTFWLDANTKAGVGEKPVTSYGGKNAEEDLAETMMMFFEAPDNLKTKCPQRYKFILEHVAPKLDRNKINAAWEQNGQGVTPLAPEAPAGPQPGVAPPLAGASITPEALKSGKEKLVPPAPFLPEKQQAPAVPVPGGGVITPDVLADAIKTLKSTAKA